MSAVRSQVEIPLPGDTDWLAWQAFREKPGSPQAPHQPVMRRQVVKRVALSTFVLTMQFIPEFIYLSQLEVEQTDPSLQRWELSERHIATCHPLEEQQHTSIFLHDMSLSVF